MSIQQRTYETVSDVQLQQTNLRANAILTRFDSEKDLRDDQALEKTDPTSNEGTDANGSEEAGH